MRNILGKNAYTEDFEDKKRTTFSFEIMFNDLKHLRKASDLKNRIALRSANTFS